MSGIKYLLLGFSILLIGIYLTLLYSLTPLPAFCEFLIIAFFIAGSASCIVGLIKFFKE